MTLTHYTMWLQSIVVRNRFSFSQISLISSLSSTIALPQLIATPARPHSTTLLKVLIPMVGRSVFMLWPTLHIFTRTGFVLPFNLYPPHLRISSSVPSAPSMPITRPFWIIIDWPISNFDIVFNISLPRLMSFL